MNDDKIIVEITHSEGGKQITTLATVKKYILLYGIPSFTYKEISHVQNN